MNKVEYSMPIDVNSEKCGYCGGCVVVCHDDAIELAEVNLIISNACTMCNACVVFCPVGALKSVDHERPV